MGVFTFLFMDSQKQEQTQPALVLAWHREAAEAVHDLELDAAVNGKFERTHAEMIQDHSAIIARHDPHAETVRLLREASIRVIEFGSSIEQEPIAERLASEIRVHLAKLKEGTK